MKKILAIHEEYNQKIRHILYMSISYGVSEVRLIKTIDRFLKNYRNQP